MKQIKLIIPMRIFPKRRPRTVINKTTGRRHTYTPKDKREDNLSDYMWEYMIERKVLTTNLKVDCIFNVTGKSRCDLDNATKTVFDCGNGILWKDDKQIKQCCAYLMENADKDSIRIIVNEV